MSTTKTKIFVLTGIILLSALLVLSFVFAMPAISSNAELLITNSFSDKITAKAYDENGNEQTTTATPISLTTPSSIIENYNSYSFAWSKIKYFEIKLDTSSLVDAQEYKYSYSVTWSPATIEDSAISFATAHTLQLELFSETVENKEDITTNFKFYIETKDGQEINTGDFVGEDVFGDSFKEYGGWGVYMFSFTFQDQIQTAVFELKPDDVYTIGRAPILSYQIQPSTTGLKNAYLFSVDEAYKYVNGYQINWYVEGKAEDGRAFVLLPSDIDDPNTQNSLYGADSQDLRTGHTFLFDPPVEGAWEIKCEILEPNLETVAFTAVSEQLSTVNGFDTMTIVWIVIGAATVIAIIVGIVIYVSIKKERVY